MRRERLPGVNNAIEMMPLPCFNKRVDVIGHNAPREERISLVVETQQGILHQFSHCGNCKITATIPHIKCSIRRLDSLSRGQFYKL